MELLEAVNTVLPHLGEHVVTRVEGARHPTVDLIVAAINRHRLRVLSEGMWFNEITLTLPVNTDGQIDVPTGTISAYGIDCAVAILGGSFKDLRTGSMYFDNPIKVKLVVDVEFSKLPLNVAQYVTYTAGAEVYTQDYGYEKSVPVLQQLASDNKLLVHQEELRQRKYNSQKRTRANFTHRVRFR